jgi:hypothetical protein
MVECARADLRRYYPANRPGEKMGADNKDRTFSPSASPFLPAKFFLMGGVLRDQDQ